MAANVSICVRAGLPKPRLVPDTERTKDTKTLDYASTPLDANTVLATVPIFVHRVFSLSLALVRHEVDSPTDCCIPLNNKKNELALS
jgi:hypothetical protein